MQVTHTDETRESVRTTSFTTDRAAAYLRSVKARRAHSIELARRKIFPSADVAMEDCTALEPRAECLRVRLMSLRGNSTAHLFLNPELGEELSDDDLKRLHCQQLADRLTSLEEKVAGVSRLLDDKCKAFTFIKLSDAFLPRTTVFYKERFDRFVACVKSICSLYIAFEAPISVIDSQYPPQIQQLFVIEGEIRNAFSSPLDGKDPLLSTESRITQIMHLVERRNSWLQDESNRQHVKTFYISALLPNAWFIPAELTLCHHLETIVIGGRISFLPKELQKLKGRGVSIFLLMTISPLAVSAGNRYFLLDSLPDCYFR